MNNETYEYIAVKATKAVTDNSINTILTERGTLKGIFNASLDELYSYRLKKDVADNIFNKRYDKQFVDNELEYAEKNDVVILTIEDDRYPKLLKQISPAPSHLYCKGDLSALSDKSIGIVGSRRASKQATEFTKRLAVDLAGVGFNIISGFAVGIDISAHLGAIERGKTVAVLGSGILDIYPKEHRKYLADICENGIVITEFAFLEPPNATNFPRRNRIISGLSLGVVVVEASLKSGSLITCRYAIEQNREVFAVPNFPNSLNNAGNRLIKDGAKLIENYLDILNEFAYLFSELNVDAKVLVTDSTAQKFDSHNKYIVYKELLLEPLSINELCMRVELPVIELLALLTELELDNIVGRDNDDKYFLNNVS